jgi:CheY-like chemotaxis protein
VGSSGLGLSQVYGVAKQFGGAIRIESRPGAGTTVHVYLPRAAVAEETAPVRPRRAEAGLVLVVDDDADVRRTTARLLRELGYAAVEAGEAQQALTLVRDDARIGLLFTDIAMPGMNGIELAERVREQRPGLPVLLMTGYPEAAKLASRRASATILEKPFSVARLADAVGGLLRSGAVR